MFYVIEGFVKGYLEIKLQRFGNNCIYLLFRTPKKYMSLFQDEYGVRDE